MKPIEQINLTNEHDHSVDVFAIRCAQQQLWPLEPGLSRVTLSPGATVAFRCRPFVKFDAIDVIVVTSGSAALKVRLERDRGPRAWLRRFLLGLGLADGRVG